MFTFKKRPIWTKRILEYYIPFSLKKFIKKLLPLCSFRFKNNNPYKRTWIRYNYDPRIRNKSLIYQTFNIKIFNINFNNNNLLINKKIAKKQDITNRFYQQICELDKNLIKNLIKCKKNLFINCLTGWITYLDFITLKKKIKKERQLKVV